MPKREAKDKKRIKRELNKWFKAHGRTAKQVKKKRENNEKAF